MNQEVIKQSPISHGFDVFISHSSRNKLIADAMKQYLQTKGIRCWKAPDDILHGESWAKAIPRAIKNSQIMVLIWTRDSMNSSQVINELTLADRAKKLIIPFRTEEIEPVDEFEYYLAKTHWLDAFGGNHNEDFELLANRVLRNLNEPQRLHCGEHVNESTQSMPECSSSQIGVIDATDEPDTSGLSIRDSSQWSDEYNDNWFTEAQICQAVASLSYFDPLIEADSIREKASLIESDISRLEKHRIISAFLYEVSSGASSLLLIIAVDSITVATAGRVTDYDLSSLSIDCTLKNDAIAAIRLNNETWDVRAYRQEMIDYIVDSVDFIKSYVSAANSKVAACSSDFQRARMLALSSTDIIERLCGDYDALESIFLSGCLALHATGDRVSAYTKISDSYSFSADDNYEESIGWHSLSPFVFQGIKKLCKEAVAVDLDTVSYPALKAVAATGAESTSSVMQVFRESESLTILMQKLDELKRADIEVLEDLYICMLPNDGSRQVEDFLEECVPHILDSTPVPSKILMIIATVMLGRKRGEKSLARYHKNTSRIEGLAVSLEGISITSGFSEVQWLSETGWDATTVGEPIFTAWKDIESVAIKQDYLFVNNIQLFEFYGTTSIDPSIRPLLSLDSVDQRTVDQIVSEIIDAADKEDGSDIADGDCLQKCIDQLRRTQSLYLPIVECCLRFVAKKQAFSGLH